MGWHPTGPEYARFPNPPLVVGRVIRIKRGAQAKEGNANSQPKHYTALLVAHAMRYGWLNGKRIKK